ncbi:MAG: Hsp20/alpha crystallin family protein [Candidatus Odinarchaeota archaeon]
MSRRRSFFDEIRRMWERMDDMMSRIWEEPVPALPGEKGGELEVKTPDVDIMETDSELVITSDMPGLSKDDIQIKVSEDAVEVSSEVKREEKEEDKGYIRRERVYRKFYRKLPLPVSVDAEKAKATYKNGVLEVRLPKKEEKKSFKLEIE